VVNPTTAFTNRESQNWAKTFRPV